MQLMEVSCEVRRFFKSLDFKGLNHYSTNRKIAGSIPDVIGIFRWHNPSGRTVGPGVDSASNRNDYQGYFLG